MNATAPNTGPLGQERGVGFAIVLSLVTLGIYGIYWIYKSFAEVKALARKVLGPRKTQFAADGDVVRF